MKTPMHSLIQRIRCLCSVKVPIRHLLCLILFCWCVPLITEGQPLPPKGIEILSLPVPSTDPHTDNTSTEPDDQIIDNDIDVL